MKASSAGTSGGGRSIRRTAKVIPLPQRRRQPRRAARVGTVVVALGVIGAMAARINGLHSGRLQTATLQSPFSAQELQLMKLANDARVKAGIAPLQFSPRLMVAARNHSRDMAARGYLGHDSPAGDTPADRARAAGLNYDELAENVYRGDAAKAAMLPERVLKIWLQSRVYSANLLSPAFRLSAVGIARADDGSYFVTQNFLR